MLDEKEDYTKMGTIIKHLRNDGLIVSAWLKKREENLLQLSIPNLKYASHLFTCTGFIRLQEFTLLIAPHYFRRLAVRKASSCRCRSTL